MVRRQDVDFYRWFSRKELQSLCKKYSLPANRSTSEYMAESLASYILRGFGIQASSGAHSRVPASRKRDSFGNELNIARGGCFQGTVVREPGFILGDSTQTQGISLSVDLNFNPSDWINSLRNEFNVYERKSTHSSELGIDNATKCKKQKSLEQDKDGNVRRESSINQAMKDNTQVPPDDPSNGERSLATIPDSSGPGQIAPSWLNRIAKADVLTWTVFGRN
ncbi:hypothetical protein F2Q68_00045119 [Brassica cretica]|uniref:Uncharacterized protein n=1 Tax=Brassica cretica TaxID=69181 RepID=A0A3N6TFX9_BRACR|nr:hypothetical protein F2Q68_00045119 [Brassica cretica]